MKNITELVNLYTNYEGHIFLEKPLKIVWDTEVRTVPTMKSEG